MSESKWVSINKIVSKNGSKEYDKSFYYTISGKEKGKNSISGLFWDTVDQSQAKCINKTAQMILRKF